MNSIKKLDEAELSYFWVILHFHHKYHATNVAASDIGILQQLQRTISNLEATLSAQSDIVGGLSIAMPTPNNCYLLGCGLAISKTSEHLKYIYGKVHASFQAIL